MTTQITRKELEKILESQVVCEVFDEIHRLAQRWNRGGALIHRVRGMGYMAEAGARNLRSGQYSPINGKSTFKEMQNLNREMYTGTINFLYPFVQSGIYCP
jgi:hypothetical protein